MKIEKGKMFINTATKHWRSAGCTVKITQIDSGYIYYEVIKINPEVHSMCQIGEEMHTMTKMFKEVFVPAKSNIKKL